MPERGRGRGLSQPPGIRVELGYAADLFKPLQGGASLDPAALDNLDLLLHFSLNPLLGLQGTSLRIHVQSHRGKSVSSSVGTLQGISNLEAPREWRIYEAWLAHQFGSPRLSVLAGIYDQNAEFSVIPGAGDLLNGAFGLGPEAENGGRAGPSTFPTTELATRIRFEPTPTLYGLLGVSDGVPGDQGQGRYSLDGGEGALISAEVGYAVSLLDAPQVLDSRSGPGRGRREPQGRPVLRGRRRQIGRSRTIVDVRTKLALGAWAFSERLESLSPGEAAGRSWGLYLLGEQLLWEGPDGTGGLSGFLRGGTAAEGVHQVDLSLGGGLVFRGGIPGRPDDGLALGFSLARNGSPFLRSQSAAGHAMDEAEAVVEVSYLAEFGPHLLIQPDLQWFRNPGMDPSLKDAWILGLRAHLLLDYPRGGTGS
jgi:porin